LFGFLKKYIFGMGKYKTPSGCYPLNDLQEEVAKNMKCKDGMLGI
jgi:hypothetical protein